MMNCVLVPPLFILTFIILKSKNINKSQWVKDQARGFILGRDKAEISLSVHCSALVLWGI